MKFFGSLAAFLIPILLVLFLYRAACTHIAFAVIGFVRLAHAHTLRGAGMYEAETSSRAIDFGDDSHVSYVLVDCPTVEKHEVTWSQVAFVNLLAVVDLLA